jgi:tetratricopeptide (TPR) repeat protein
MPKTPSNKLFSLIKSLSGSEKRYFKIFANTRGGKSNKYIKLFEAIDKQAEFDEDELKATVYGNAPIESRKYSELKAYLYELILKSLHAFDEKTSVDFRLKNMLQSVRVLFKRSHFDECKEILKKAKKLAFKYEQFNTIIDLLNWEKNIASAETDISFLDKELSRINEQEEWCLQRLQNISEYRNIFFQLLLCIRKDVSRRKEQIEELKLIIDHPLLENFENAKSHTAQVLFYRIFSIYYFSISDANNFYDTSQTLIKLLESKKFLLQEDVSEYISVLNNHVVSCGKLNKIKEIRDTLDKYSKIKPITVDDELKILRQYYMGKFSLCIYTGEFEEGYSELLKHKKQIKKFDSGFFNNNTFFFQYFVIYFGVGDYENALRSLNDWLALPKNIERKDLQSLARVLNLIIHYELGNTMLLESLLRSTYRFLNKENRLFEFEKKFLNFIRESLKPHSKKELKKILEALKKDFEDLSKTSAKGSFGLFDMTVWLESKITGNTYAEIMKERFLLSQN